ncbi:MAG: hypothetical protein R3245_04955 [Kiloniellales bacterium]|nr:hypothetical protein [Kiloniellales bacterium]
MAADGRSTFGVNPNGTAPGASEDQDLIKDATEDAQGRFDNYETARKSPLERSLDRSAGGSGSEGIAAAPVYAHRDFLNAERDYQAMAKALKDATDWQFSHAQQSAAFLPIWSRLLGKGGPYEGHFYLNNDGLDEAYAQVLGELEEIASTMRYGGLDFPVPGRRDEHSSYTHPPKPMGLFALGMQAEREAQMSEAQRRGLKGLFSFGKLGPNLVRPAEGSKRTGPGAFAWDAIS